MLFLFGRRKDGPTCPECGGPRSPTLALCTECGLKARQGVRPSSGSAPPASSGYSRDSSAGWGSTPLPGAAPRAAPSSSPAPAGAGHLRAKQGVHVASETEREVADFLWDNEILFGYDQDIGGHRVAFTIPGKHLAIDTRDDRERDEMLRARGLHLVKVGERGRVREELKNRLMSKYPGKAWQ